MNSVISYWIICEDVGINERVLYCLTFVRIIIVHGEVKNRLNLRALFRPIHMINYSLVEILGITPGSKDSSSERKIEWGDLSIEVLHSEDFDFSFTSIMRWAEKCSKKDLQIIKRQIKFRFKNTSRT